MSGRGPSETQNCPQCGAEWVFRAPWWAAPKEIGGAIIFGFVVHCSALHWEFYEADLSADELREARRVLERRVAGDAIVEGRGQASAPARSPTLP